ncbi:MAG: ribonuclease HII, partial [Candidatus Thermoplasmatota archaeon]|nr:ribonuclease HII [Candidatus Thermoplasmatota archaeon]
MPKGPVIGPLVVAGVTFADDTKLIELKVKDSKKCTPKRRENLAKQIKENALNYEILVIPASAIDDMRKVMTLNEIEVNAFIKIIKKLKPEICYVDSADVDEERFATDILSGLSFKPTIISKHKADDIYPIVSAASILAKSKRDEEIQKIAQELQKKINLPLGSGYPADPITKKFIKSWFEKYGKLPPYTRRSWNTSKKILNE